MNIQSVLSKRPVTWAIFIVCLLFSVFGVMFASSGLLPVQNVYDAPIYIMEALNAGHGLTPYKDFGFVYPPGAALFFGKLLTIRDPGIFYRVSWFVSFLLYFLNAFLLTRIKNGYKGIIAAGLLLLIALQPLLVLFYTHGVEQFSLPLLLTVTLVTLIQVHAEKPSSILGILFFSAFIMTLFRYDRAVGMVGIECAFAILAWCSSFAFSKSVKTDVRRKAMRFGYCGIALVLGTGAGLLFIYVYSKATDAWPDTWRFVFEIPYLILSYRSLPLPPFVSLFNDGNLWRAAIIGMCFLAIGGGVAFAKRRNPDYLIEILVLLAAPVAMIPYAFGRADYAHFAPMAGLLISSLFIACVLWRENFARIICVVALVLLVMPFWSVLEPFYGLMVKASPTELFTLQNGAFNRNLEAVTGDCAKMAPSGTQSIFIGRDSYAHYIFNPMILYVALSHLRPASRFMAEDPGVQNSCEFGNLVADDLRQSPRPMIAFLISNPQHQEPNATATMSSCGKIEEALKQPSKHLGSCLIHGDTAQVMLYP